LTMTKNRAGLWVLPGTKCPLWVMSRHRVTSASQLAYGALWHRLGLPLRAENGGFVDTVHQFGDVGLGHVPQAPPILEGLGGRVRELCL
jgi:hypothetical protein